MEVWEAGAREGLFEAEKFKTDVTKTPIPRFDLLKFDDYLHIGVQFSRGCPFTCEFCESSSSTDACRALKPMPRCSRSSMCFTVLVIAVTSTSWTTISSATKRPEGLSSRGHKVARSTRLSLRFTTEASINLADDRELLMLLNRANFVGVFVGIESPDPATLIAIRKKQNTKRSIAQSIHKIYSAGLFVTAGFIVGFDSETQSMADAMVELIEEAAIPICMVGLLYALPNTQLASRLEKEGRLHPPPLREDLKSADQCTMGLNYATLRPRREILADYIRILERIYDPAAFWDACSAWRRCSTIPAVRNKRAREIRGAGLAVSKWRIGSLQACPNRAICSVAR